jgi:hypothetical protein
MILIATSGYYYNDWQGVFYPPDFRPTGGWSIMPSVSLFPRSMLLTIVSQRPDMFERMLAFRHRKDLAL